ncbi:MAG: hypothetical protein WDW36_005681 [Sanguina aurantia]
MYLDVDSTFVASGRNIGALVFAVLAGALANAAGVGGGAIFISMFQVIVGFALKPSTVLSQAVITAGSIISVGMKLPQRHPAFPDASLIDFDIVLALTPLLLAGVSQGVLLNVILSEWLITFLLLVLLIPLSFQSVAKGVRLWRQETRAFAKRAATPLPLHSSGPPPQATPPPALPTDVCACAPADCLLEAAGPPAQPLRHRCTGKGHSPRDGRCAACPCPSQTPTSPGRHPESPPGHMPGGGSIHVDPVPELCDGGVRASTQPAATGRPMPSKLEPVGSMPQPLTRKTPGRCCGGCACAPNRLSALPVGLIAKVVCSWLLFVGLQLGKSSVRSCSGTFWGLYVAQVVAMLLISAWVIVAGRRAAVAARVRPEESEGEAGSEVAVCVGKPSFLSNCSARQLTVYAVVTFMAGLTGGMLGLGGGMMMGPLLLEMGLIPQVTSATSTVMVLLSSSAALSEFAILRLVNLTYALVFGGAGMVSTVLGVALSSYLLARLNRPSILVIFLSGVMLLSTGLVCVFGLMSAVTELQGHQNSFQGLCPTS